MTAGRRPPALARSVAVVLALVLPAAGADTYSLSFSKRADRLTWRPTFPGWNFKTPVTLSAAGDSTAMLRMSASASLNAILDQRGSGNWDESASVSTSVLYPILGSRASIGINANMSSRKATLVHQRTRSQTVNFRFEYQPLSGSSGVFDDLRFGVVPGVITARRASPVKVDSLIEETGLQYNGSLSTSPTFQIGGQDLNTSLSLSKTDNTLKNNRNRGETVRVSSAYTLPGDARASLALNQSRSQQGVTRSVADSADTAVVAELSERLNTGLSSSLSLKVMGFDVTSSQSWSGGRNRNTANADEDPRNRYFARDRENENRDFQARVSGKLTPSLDGSTQFSWSATDERRLPVTLANGSVYRDATDDREDRNLQLSGALNWSADGHQVRLSSTARMNRVDNPGAPEQDRDNFNGVTDLSYGGRRDSGLRYDVTLTSSLAHRINLDASRAGENQRNRELRLSTNTSYQRLQANLSHAFEISARRTIFDFDRQVNLNPIDRRSNIRRGWSMTHRLQRALFETLQLSSSYTYRADDFGTLLVEDEAQIVEEDNTDHVLATGVSYRPDDALSVGVNYSYRLDRRWSYTYARSGALRDLSSRNAHRNLAANLDYKPSGYTGFSVRASRSRQRAGTFDDLSITLSRVL